MRGIKSIAVHDHRQVVRKERKILILSKDKKKQRNSFNGSAVKINIHKAHSFLASFNGVMDI